MNDEIKTLPLFNQSYPHGSPAFINLIKMQVQQALDEDIGNGDLTALLIEETHQAEATIVSKDHAVLCGVDWVNTTFKKLDNNVKVDWLAKEADSIHPEQTLCKIKGSARALLSAERCALNFLQTLSAVATQTNQYAELIIGTGAKILDTRKTLPGLRLAQKYAVTVGGGYNQRLALYDAILIKENHISAAGSIAAALTKAQSLNTNASIQIEVESLDELKQSLDAGATNILLDDFTLDELKQAVKTNHILYQKQAILEASGNVELSTIQEISKTGVDYISSGALTHSVKALDYSLLIR